MRILVVDDETFVAELVKLALEADGHVCYTAVTSEDARAAVGSVRPDIVAADLLHDEADPLAWIEELILSHPDLRGRVVVLTDEPLAEADRFRLAGSGAGVMPKPFTLDDVRRAVSEITEA